MIEDSSEFRRIMGHFATGVSVVGTVEPEGGRPCALTANAVASVSLNPMLVLVCVEKASDTHDCLLESGCFSVNILGEDQERLARRFADFDTKVKFEGVAYRTESTGAPVLEDVLAWLDCNTRETFPGGDHTIVVGEAAAGDARAGGSPLVYYRSGYGRLVL